MAYPNLPGVQVMLNDLGLQVTAPPAGPKVTIFGACGNTGIPLREPLTVTSLPKATAAFYTFNDPGVKYPSELALAIDEAARAGGKNIEVVCIKNDLSGHSSNKAYLTGDARYVDLTTAYAAMEDKQFSVVVPVNAHLDSVATTGQYGPQLANFCFQVTTEVDSAAIGVIGTMPVIQWAHTYEGYASGASDGNASAGLVTASVAISGEVVGISDDAPLADYFFGLPSSALVDEWVKYAGQDDSPTITDTYTGNTGAPRTFPGGFKNYLHGSDDEDGNFYPTNDANAATAVNSAYWSDWHAQDLDGNVVYDKQGNRADGGARISVVAAPLRTASPLTKKLAAGVSGSMSNTHHATDGAAAYAGRITALSPQSAPTNKQIGNLTPQRTLSAKQANTIAARRLVTFHKRSTGFVVSSAMTGAHNVSRYVRSDFVRLSTVRIVDSAISVVRSIGDHYIGEPNTAAMRNAMAAEIDKIFVAMKQAGAMNDYQFFITASPDDQVLGQCFVELTLVPAFELIKINVSVSLAKEIV
jgi:hypothetical protein